MESRKKIKPREITCASCGAHYGAELLRCPYCKSVNDLADEREFMEDLGKIRRDMAQIPSEGRKEEAREAIQDVRKVFRSTTAVVFALIFAVSAMLFISRFFGARMEDKREAERAEEYAWKNVNFPKLDALYEQEDWDGLLELSNELQEGPLYEWDHYDLLVGLHTIEQAKEDIAILEEVLTEKELPESRAKDYTVWVLKDELEVYFFNARCRIVKDCDIIRERGASVLEDLETRFALTEEEMAYFAEEAEKNYDYFSYDKCKEFLENRQKRGQQ